MNKNKDTKIVKAFSLIAMVILLLILAYNVFCNMDMLMSLPTYGLVSYLLGTLFAILGWYKVIDRMNTIEAEREEY